MSGLSLYMSLNQNLTSLDVQLIPLNNLPYNSSHIISLGKFNQNWSQLMKFPISWIIYPTGDRNSIQRLDAVALRNIVNNNHIFQVSAQSTQIFDVEIVFFRVSAVFSVKLVKLVSIFIKLVDHNWCIAWHWSCKNANFVVFCHIFKKFSCSWPVSNKNLAWPMFIINIDNMVRIFTGNESGMNQSFI